MARNKTTDLLSAAEAIEAVREKRTKPSFMASIMEGRPDFHLIYPYPFQSAEDKAEGDRLLAKLREVLDEWVDADEIDRTAEIPVHVIYKLAEIGCFGINIPKEYGGLGLLKINYNRALMLIGSKCDVLGLTVSANSSIGLPHPLKHFATEEQRQMFFPLIAKGAISAFALTEKEAGSDPSRMQSRVELSEDGEFYILNGEKWYCTNGMIAENILVMAKTEPYGPKDITAFILSMNTPGITRERREFSGYHGLENATLRFDNVRIPKENVIGEWGKGLKLALTALNDGRISVSALCLAPAKRAWKPTLWWANERVQFGRPIGQFEANKEKIAQMHAYIFAMDAVTWLAAALGEAGKVDIRIEAAASKLFCSEALYRKVIEYAMELRGGRGYETVDSLRNTGEIAIPAERWLRDARIYLIGEGTSATLHLSLIRDLLQPLIDAFSELKQAQGLKKVAKGIGFGRVIAKLFFRRVAPKGVTAIPEDLFNGSLGQHFQYVENTSKRLADKIFDLSVRYRKALEEKQLLTFRITDICLNLFLMSVVCVYADLVGRGKIKQYSEVAMETADYFCSEMREATEILFAKLDKNNDEQAVMLGELALEYGANWHSEGIIDVM